MTAVTSFANPTLTELRGEVERLRVVRSQLAQRLDDAASQLESPGCPPAVGLIDDLRSYRDRLRILATELGAETDLTAETVTFNALERLVEERDCRQFAESVLEKLCELTHVDIPDFAPLALCRQEASRLCELSVELIASSRNSDLMLLRQQKHPLNSLIRLCEEGDRLSDNEWTACQDEVATNYGRQLATALTRGRIQRKKPAAPAPEPVATKAPDPISRRIEIAATLPKSPVPKEADSTIDFVPKAVPVSVTPVLREVPAPAIEPTKLVVSGTEVLATAVQPPITAARPKAADLSIFEPADAHETIFDVTSPSPSLSARLRAAMNVGETGDRSTAADSIPTTVRQATVPAMGTPAIRSRDFDRPITPEMIKGHLVRLMSEDRLPLAMHLTRCLEQRPERPDYIFPSWLMRSLILGRHLSYSKGEIARQLDEELREFRVESLSEGDQEHQLAMAFLCRAAAIPAALLAGSVPATAILRSFKIAPGFSQLYNYCSRIALYGDRLAGSLMEMFRPEGTISGASELDDLRQSTLDWLQEAARKAVSYSRTSPLFLHAHWTLTAGTAVRYSEATVMWCKWQETLSLAQKLLKPVCEQIEGERNWVRQEITRLTTQVRVEPVEELVKPGTPGISSRGIVLASEEMHSVILEAVAIANRWLRLCHQTSFGASPIPVEALELRDEILKRSDGVVTELSQHRQSTKSPLVHAAIGCCQTTIRQIQAMFESRIALPLVESDPRHVLNADLLRIPGIELNDQWMPETDAAIVERELLASLETSEMNWAQSFDYHSRAGNHEATGRLLELDVWANPIEKDSLKAARQNQINDARIAFNSELDELATDIDSLMNAGVCSVSEGGVFGQRLDRLRYELPRVVDFSAFRRQVQQLQTAILRLNTTGASAAILGPDSDATNVRNTAIASVAALNTSPAPPASIQSFDIFSGE
ncbi:MAG: hypothetical protein U0941_16400 [Planctomycetaceae bacterium]